VGVWLYDGQKKKMVCNEIFIKNTNSFRTNDIILVSSNKIFFEELKSNPYILLENNKDNVIHSVNYIQRNKINSCVIVPIWFKGDVIGMISFENHNNREWLKEEIDFVQLLTSTYSFGYAVYQNNLTAKDLIEFEKFIDRSVLVSKSDVSGKITYVNKKFQEVSGWGYEDIIGKDHSFFKSGDHSKAFWNDMFNVILKEKKVWNKIITNKNKNGELYWVDSYIKADFDNVIGKLIGYEWHQESIHTFLGKLYFNKEELTDEEYSESKTITFKQLYGGVNKKYKHIEFFAKIDAYIEDLWENYKRQRAISLPTGRILKYNSEMNKLKLFNYVIQNQETLANVSKIERINQYLEEKKLRTKLVLITYDSFLLDFSANDGKKTLLALKTILEEDGMIVKHKHGLNYSFLN